MNRLFEVSTDSTCDLYAHEVENLEIDVAHLEYVISQGDDLEVEFDNYKSREEYLDFYDRLKKGAIAKTSVLNVQAHVDLFTKMAERGVKKAIHISQGYGLSPTVDNANKAIEIVKEKFSDIDYIAIESNTTTCAEGFIVKACVKMRDEGKSKEEAIDVLHNILFWLMI